jgi:hypothetical protein
MPGAGQDSFISAVTRDRRVQGSVLPALQQIAAGGRQTARSVPPIPVPTTDRVEPAPGVPGVPGESPQTPPIGVLPGEEPTITPLATAPNVPALDALINSDLDFYTRTGRMPGAVDKALMQGRRTFLANKGRLPTPDELLYEAQRGLIQDNSGTRIS